MLEVIAEEEFGVNQTTVILVKVKSISYLMINTDTRLLTQGGHLTSIPVGTTLHFTITYHDDVGDKFFATNSLLKFRCSRYNLLHVSNGLDNNTLVVKTAEAGQTVLKAWDKKNPWIADYINIPVDCVIKPAQTLVTLTSVICLSTPLLSSTGDSGKWSSDSTDIDIDSTSGIAVALAVGTTNTVFYTVSQDLMTYTEINIDPIRNLDLNSNLNALSNGLAHKSVSVPIRVDANGTLKGDNCSARIAEDLYLPLIIPFRCHMQLTNQQTDLKIKDLFTVLPEFDPRKGQYVCKLESIQNEYMTHQISTLNTKILLHVTLPTQEGQPEITSNKLLFDFHPAFYVHNSEVLLTTTSPLSSLRVSTKFELIDSIKIVVSDSSLIESLIPERDTQSGAVILFPVRLLDTFSIWERESLDLFVEMSSHLTGQKVRVPVLVKLLGQKPDGTGFKGGYARDVGWGMLIRNILFNYQSWFVLFIIILITAASVLFGYNAILGSRYKTTANSNVFLSNSGSPLQAVPHSSFIQPQGTPPPYSGFNSTSVSPKLWSVNYNQQDPNISSLKRSPYSFNKS
ncbi:nuclear pore membrane glycoprotein 210-like [Patella vulgata]|uniref:nuclear pore membrane glycoprotein 210-like n=1 Tax=Patella vulgata TaxID=6465 RepID=UPI00217F79C7|nr:nuclear pore membrane glycoprotein 210-like [Patella vulgata]XP_050414078.1 nuclear pore membrane glycoprotein 210-like [Patella vulgata]